MAAGFNQQMATEDARLSEAQPGFSLVVPSYNEEARIGGSLRRIGVLLSGLSFPCEVIVVDDGSEAPGLAAVQAALASLPAGVERRLLRHEANRGKGAAVRTGCLAASGRRIAFIDADLATPPEDLALLLEALERGADVAIGVRNQADGSDMRSRRGLARRLAGWAFSLMMRAVLLPDIADSQCPIKAFTRPAAQTLFRLQKIETWAFDAELLFLAHRLGLTVEKIPVRWRAMPGSHLRLDLRTAAEVWNLLRIRWLHRGVSSTMLASDVPEAGSP